MNYMGKSTDTKHSAATKLINFLAKTCTADRASSIELLILVLDFVVNSRLKIPSGIFVECMEYLYGDA